MSAARPLTPAKVEAGLHKHGGNIAAVARANGVARASVWEYVQNRPDLVRVLEDCRERLKDDAESQLQKAVKRGEAWAVCFFLKCKAKDRGYVERQEHTGADGGPLEVREVVVRDRREAAALLEYIRGNGGESEGGTDGHAGGAGAGDAEAG